MNQSLIAHRYATALYRLAEERQLTERLYEDTQLVRAQLSESPSLVKFLNAPYVSVTQKKELIQKVFQQHVDLTTLNFLELVLGQGRHSFLSEMLRVYELLYKKARNIRSVEVTTAKALLPDQIERVKMEIQLKLHADIELTLKEKPAIVGGLIIRVDDHLLDASIATQLKHIEKQLME